MPAIAPQYEIKPSLIASETGERFRPESKAGFLMFAVTNQGEQRRWYAVVEGELFGGWLTKRELAKELIAAGVLAPMIATAHA